MRWLRNRYLTRTAALIALAAVLGPLLIGLAVSGPVPLSGWEEVEVDREVDLPGIRLTLPEGWMEMEQGEQTSLSSNGIASVFLGSAPAEGETLESAVSRLAETVGVEEGTPAEGQLAGVAARGYRFRDDAGEHEILVAVAADRIIMWVASTPAEWWDEHEPVFRRMQQEMALTVP